jgi:Xaa-Pro aminopeptidase
MGYYGKTIPECIRKAFDVVINARNVSLEFIELELRKNRIPAGKEIDKITREFINKSEFKGKFIHGTGHPLGFTSPHGNRSNINTRGKQTLKINLGYTIEPGIYLKDEFGIRSEIDFYINDKQEVVITTAMQKEIVMIKEK